MIRLWKLEKFGRLRKFTKLTGFRKFRKMIAFTVLIPKFIKTVNDFQEKGDFSMALFS